MVSIRVFTVLLLAYTAVLPFGFLLSGLSDIPATKLTMLAMLAVGFAKVFGAACFVFADQRWVRFGGVTTVALCGLVTMIPFALTVGFPARVPGYDMAWHFFDRQLGLALGTVKPLFAAVLAGSFEVVLIVFLRLQRDELRPVQPARLATSSR